jgi:hypothetical protein
LQIYAGISWTSRDITPVWYPSGSLNGAQGILVGAYIWSNKIGKRFTAMAPGERLAAAIADGECVHPGYARACRSPGPRSRSRKAVGWIGPTPRGGTPTPPSSMPMAPFISRASA